MYNAFGSFRIGGPITGWGSGRKGDPIWRKGYC